jgi:hypothetical protein
MILLGKAFTKLPYILNNLCKGNIWFENTTYSNVNLCNTYVLQYTPSVMLKLQLALQEYIWKQMSWAHGTCTAELKMISCG